MTKNRRAQKKKAAEPKQLNKWHIIWKVVLGFLIFVKDLFIGIMIALVSLFVIVLIFLYIVYLNYAKEFHTAKIRNNSTQNIIYDRDGGVIYRSFGASMPQEVDIENVPGMVVQATLAAEDPDFYKHGAIDPRGIARATYVNVLQSQKTGISKLGDLFNENSYVQGGSSITQQLIKNIYLTDERTFDRKVREMIYSFEYEKTQNKDAILEMYLNNVYYGEQALGVENAANRYFDKRVDELNLAEISMLAGLPVSPSRLSPLSGDFDEAKKRQEYVLSRMVSAGNITLEEAEQAANEPLYLNYENVDSFKKHPYYADHAISVAKDIIGEENFEKGGYEIHTYLDPAKQVIAEETAQNYMDKFKNRKVTNAAVVILDNKESEIAAMVGGVDYEISKVNVALSRRQPGSSFKPIVYLTGLLNNYSAATRLVDKYVNFGGVPAYAPRNYDGSYRGNITVHYALANSLNIPAVEMAKLVGINRVINTAHILGIDSINKDVNEYGLSLALGSAEVTPFELSRAFSVLANNGKMGNFSAIEKIDNLGGETIYIHQKIQEQAVDEKAAYIMTNILSDNQARSMVFGTRSPLVLSDRKVAAKTGTTDDYADSWTMGFTSQYTVGVWMGNNDHSKMARVSGVEGAAYIWHDIIAGIHKDLPAEDFERPEGLNEVWVNPYTGLKVTNHSKPNILEIFIPGTEPADKPDFDYLKQFYR